MSELRIALLQIAAAGYDQAANLETGLAVCRHAAELGAGEDVYAARLDLDALRDWRRREVWGGAYRRPGCYGRLTDEGSAAPQGMLGE